MRFDRMIILTLIFVFTIGLYPVMSQVSPQPPQPSREVLIPNSGLPNSIRDFIVDDLAANGEDVVNDTKYLLQRGEIYVNTEQYEAGHKLWLEAEPGDGPRPVIQPITLGQEAPRLARMTDDMTYISLRYEGRDQTGSHTDNAPYRQRGDSTTCWVQDQLVIDHRHEIWRVDAGFQTWKVYDNIIGHNYRQDVWERGDGFNFRNTRIDSFIVKNNTFYMSKATLANNNLYGGCNYFEFSQNTVFAYGGIFVSGQIGGSREAAILNLGTAQNVVFTNNLFQNVGMFAYDPIFADSMFVINLDLTDSTGTVDFSYNNFYRDQDFLDLNPDSVQILEFFDPELTSLMGPGIISEPVVFNDVPAQDRLKEALQLWWEQPQTAGQTFFRLDSIPDIDAVNLGYVAGASATGSSTGGPLGDARWYDDVVVSVEDNSPQVVESFSLHGNYPNPFNPSTTIQFDLPSSAQVQVTVTNLLGQTVYETPAKSFTAGFNQKINIEAGNWTSGVYFYQVTAKMKNQTAVQTGKMMLLK